jgi:hypothetical protein
MIVVPRMNVNIESTGIRSNILMPFFLTEQVIRHLM